jgi:hypothetical protein
MSKGGAMSEADQTLLGVSRTLAALVVLYSEFTLKATGCGLPAGPFGLLGAAEGIGYLAVVGLAGYSLYTKVRTGTGLPAGPGGILGAAEGLSLATVPAAQLLEFCVCQGRVGTALPVSCANGRAGAERSVVRVRELIVASFARWWKPSLY